MSTPKRCVINLPVFLIIILFTHNYVRATFQTAILPFYCHIFVHVAKLHKFHIQQKSQNIYYTRGRSPLWFLGHILQNALVLSLAENAV